MNMFRFNKNAKIKSIDIILICDPDVFAVKFKPIQFIKCSVFMMELSIHVPCGKKISHDFV